MTKAYNLTKCCNSTPLHIFTAEKSLSKNNFIRRNISFGLEWLMLGNGVAGAFDRQDNIYVEQVSFIAAPAPLVHSAAPTILCCFSHEKQTTSEYPRERQHIKLKIKNREGEIEVKIRFLQCFIRLNWRYWDDNETPFRGYKKKYQVNRK